MKGGFSFFLLLSITYFATQPCACFSIRHQRFLVDKSLFLRNSNGQRPNTRLNIFPQNESPSQSDNSESAGAKFVSTNNGYLESLSSAYQTTEESPPEPTDLATQGTQNGAWRDPFSSATSAFSNAVKTGTNDFSNAVKTGTNDFSNAVKTGTNDFGNAVWTSTNRVSSAVKTGTNDLTSGIGAVAQRGTDDFAALANSANFNARRSAVKVRSLARKGTGEVGKVASWIDSQAKMGTQAIGSQAKSMVVKFTGKENYEFGDIVKETIRRILSQEVNIADTILLLKILLAIGASIGPLAELLPVAVLLQGLNVSIETKIGGKILEALAHSLDNRFVAAFTGDDKFLLGDAAKRSMMAGILAFTGKSTYEAGDIQRAVADGRADGHDQLQIAVDPELEAWDQAFTESIEMQKMREQVALLYSNPDGTPLEEEAAKELDMQLASELEEWSSVFRKDYADYGL